MRLNGFDLNQLVCLEALLIERNVSRAAERVHLSQSAMSWTLAKLREHFQDPLLVRSGRNLVVTPFARDLLGPVTELLTGAHALTTRAPAQTSETVDRELRIVASDYVMSACLSDAIRRAMQEMPNLRFDVLPLTSGAGQALSAGEIDLLCAGQAFEVDQPPNELLFDDVFVCLACAEHGPTTPFDAAAYMSRRHVVVRYFENRMTFEDETMLWREGLKRSHQIAVWSYALVPQLICGTPLIATIRSRIAERMAAQWPVKVLPFPYEQTPVRALGYWHASRDEDPVLKRFLEIVRDVAATDKR
tara:strand:+ start:57 stop:965 length:909 start_codon:yes stop_codon:yes gene_type:complete